MGIAPSEAWALSPVEFWELMDTRIEGNPDAMEALNRPTSDDVLDFEAELKAKGYI